MSEEFKDQGGAASMSPSPLKRWLASKVISHINRPGGLEKRRAKLEATRQKQQRAHVVEYFHQLDDGYSHLAAQMLKPLLASYDIELVCHLVVGPQGDNSVEPELLLQLSRVDAHLVAPHYGLQFPQHPEPANPEAVALASAILAKQDSQTFIEIADQVGSALWRDDLAALQTLAEQFGQATELETQEKITQGTELRTKLKHYSGAMFYYEGVWYWGVDRLYHLEGRLRDLHAGRKPNTKLLAPRPAITTNGAKDNGSLTFEVYASLRSPYTAMIFDRAVQFAHEAGVKLVVRPVLPMVMRGVPATREKGMYIFADTTREAKALGINYGNFYDPIGEPVQRAYSLYPWACEQGKGTELLSAFLSSAFAEGVNTNKDTGLKHVVEKAGLDWQQAKGIVGTPGWEEALEENRLAMYGFGSWGVPSFRLLDADGKEALALWGQDRLWLFGREIERLLTNNV